MSEVSEIDQNVILLIGRIEGKVDTIIHFQGTHGSRIDALEQRTAALEQRQAASEAANTSSKGWLANLLSVGALVISAISAYFGIKS